jgi:hypothetical protein
MATCLKEPFRSELERSYFFTQLAECSMITFYGPPPLLGGWGGPNLLFHRFTTATINIPAGRSSNKTVHAK